VDRAIDGRHTTDPEDRLEAVFVAQERAQAALRKLLRA
jgi:hypothetical protein